MRKGGRHWPPTFLRPSINSRTVRIWAIYGRILCFILSFYRIGDWEEMFEVSPKYLYFNLLRSTHLAVSVYADGCVLLVSGAFLTSASVSKKLLPHWERRAANSPPRYC